ncbi:hypothetical protein E6R61_26680 [Streptomyces sp. LRa12]|nr:hypothetical protein E6R61_26680 [Streptomyces sp. LRa12]
MGAQPGAYGVPPPVPERPGRYPHRPPVPPQRHDCPQLWAAAGRLRLSAAQWLRRPCVSSFVSCPARRATRQHRRGADPRSSSGSSS